MASSLDRQLDISTLEFNDPPQLIWVRVKDAIGLLWDENPKLHDIGGVIASIVKHGFQDLPKFDGQLTNVSGGDGGIKSGNGRIEALFKMEQQRMLLPRGLAKVIETGDWAMPLVVGTDAGSKALARSYAIDANNLTMSGGDFEISEIMRLWDAQGYYKVLETLALEDPTGSTMPVSVDLQDLNNIAAIIAAMNQELTPDEARGLLLDKFKDFGLHTSEGDAEQGDIYLIAGRHFLAILDVFRDWQIYTVRMKPDMLFIPLPGPLIFTTKIAATTDLFLVQPDLQLAGLILQSALRVYGESAIVKQ